MVTTRRQSGKHTIDETDEEDTTQLEPHSSSRKRQKSSARSGGSEQLDDEGTATPAAKKQKVLPVRAKDDELPKRNTRVVVEIPVSQIGLEYSGKSNTSPKLPQREASTTEDVEEVEDIEDDVAVPSSRLEIPDSESDDDNSELGESVEKADTPSPEKAQPKTTSLNTTSPKISGSPSAPKSKHKRFGSEEPEEEVEIYSTAIDLVESEDESSDDDAPEVVGAHEALDQAKLKEREAAKAVEERESAIRKKRKERDAILKKQASKKRKRDVRADAEEAATAKTLRPSHPVDAMHSSDDEDENEAKDAKAAAPALRLGPGRALPEFLPDEYLEDEESEEEASEPTQLVKKAKKIKFTELVEKKPKDYRKGSTTYRVAEAPNKKMAPKSSFNARKVKESWLQGRTGVTRKPLSSGFFKTR